jgi:2'-5' RNA ligase
MSPTLISDIAARSRQGAFWRENIDPGPALGRDLSGAQDTVFFGFYPPPEIAARVCQLARNLCAAHGLGGRLVGLRCLHVTVLGINRYGRLSDRTIDMLAGAAATMRMSPFLVGLDRAVSFNGKPERPIVLVGDDGVTGIRMLRQSLVEALRGAGLQVGKDRDFTPHLTLLYDRRELGELAVEEISWTVRDFVLIRSLHGCSRHIPLGRWPLRG